MGKMNDQDELTVLQFDILDTLYFIEPYEHILEEVNAPAAVVGAELRFMIDRGWVQVMQYDEKSSDYRRTMIYDSDNLGQYGFLATKEGLLKHNGHR
jgi:hypothetical protein